MRGLSPKEILYYIFLGIVVLCEIALLVVFCCL